MHIYLLAERWAKQSLRSYPFTSSVFIFISLPLILCICISYPFFMTRLASDLSFSHFSPRRPAFKFNILIHWYLKQHFFAFLRYMGLLVTMIKMYGPFFRKIYTIPYSLKIVCRFWGSLFIRHLFMDRPLEALSSSVVQENVCWVYKVKFSSALGHCTF